MGNGFKILILEDSTSDVDSIEHELIDGGLEFSSRLVETRKDFIREFKEFKPDLILSDFYFPDFDGFSALEMRNDNSPETPFIFVSSTVGEDLAVQTLLNGATDYVLKNNFSKLVSVVLRALDETEDRLELEVTEKELVENEEKLRKIFESPSDSIIVTDLKGSITELNHATLNLLGFSSVEEILGMNFLDLLAERDRTKAKKSIRSVLYGSPKFREYNFLKKDGQEVPVEVSTTVISDSSGAPVSFVSITRDRTEAKLNEEKLRKSLREKENLLKEIHHRVKNNMQIISSLLNLQSEHVYDDRDAELFKSAQERVKTMAMVHGNVYQSKDLSSINFREFIQTLAFELFSSREAGPNIKLETDIADISMNIETAIPCGLIVNELMTNCLIHAFPEDAISEDITETLKSSDDDVDEVIKIELQIEENGHLILIMSDNGVGLSEDIDFKNPKTLGLKLVNTLVSQLNGNIEIERNNGTEFIITFDEMLYDDRIPSKHSESMSYRSKKLRGKAEDLLKGKIKGFEQIPDDVNEIIHELQVHQIELEVQNEELRDTQIKLEESQRKYYDLYNFAPVGYFTFDEKGMIINVNQTGASLLGVGKSDLINYAFIPYIAPDYRYIFYQNTLKAVETGEKQIFELKLIKKDSSEFFGQLVTVAPFDQKGDSKKLRTSLININERFIAEKALRESEEKFRNMADLLPQIVFEADKKGNITFINRAVFESTGYTEEDFYEEINPIQLLIPEDRNRVKNDIRKVLSGEELGGVEYTALKKDGTKFPIMIYSSKITRNNQVLGIRGVILNMTQIKEAENQIKLSLKEKEMLLKEIHHRVKNNLMVISSLLNLQSRYIRDEASKDIFKESQNRARSMALIHERLYQTTDLKRIDFGDYIRTLSQELFRTYAGDFGLIDLKINVEDIFLDINTAIPLGLIVNELITNSLTHAFPDGMKGEINVDFQRTDDHYEFTVKDNGIGFPYDLDFQKTASLGLQIVNSLTEQIFGEIELNRSHGTEFKITFKD